RPKFVGNSGDEAKFRGHGFLAGVQQHEAAGAVCILGFADLETNLADQGRLLITKITGDRHTANRRNNRAPVGFAAGNDLRQNLFWNSEILQDAFIPLQRSETHELGTAGVGHVGNVNAATRATGETPDEKAVDSAAEQLRYRHVFERREYSPESSE